MKKYLLIGIGVVIFGAALGVGIDISSNFTTQQIMNWVFNSADSSLKISYSTGNGGNLQDAIFGGVDTNTGATDTLTRQITDTTNTMTQFYSAWWQCSISADDTILISSGSGFAANNDFELLPGESWDLKQSDVTAITNLYYKRKGTAGTPRVRFTIGGN